MAIATYADLQSQVRSWTGTDSTVIANGDIDNFLYGVEQEIWTKLRVKEMRDSLNYAYATGGQAFSGFDSSTLLDIISVNVTLSSSDIRTPSPAAEFRLRNLLGSSDTQNPSSYGWLSQSDGSEKLVIAPEPLGATVDVSYWKKFVSVTSATNVVFLAYPHIWEAGTVARAFLWMQDMDMYTIWKDMFDNYISMANEQNRGGNEGLKGNTTVPNLGYQVP